MRKPDSGNCIFVEGGGDSRELRTRCREGFRELLENAGLEGRVPHIVASGSRRQAYNDFKAAHESAKQAKIYLLVDSEDPVSDGEKTWEHLKKRDGWERPAQARDEQVLLMTTCMETWIVADRATLRKLYRSDCLKESSLPALHVLETKDRHTVQDALKTATSGCKNAYAKNKRSFETLHELNPETLKSLPSFARAVRILNEELPK